MQSMDNKTLRLKNARALINIAGNIDKFAEKIKRSPSQASQVAGKTPTRGIGDRLARHIEICFDKPRGWIDQEHETDPMIERAEKIKRAYLDSSAETRLMIERMFGILDQNDSGREGNQ
jgi:hypothetical protein